MEIQFITRPTATALHAAAALAQGRTLVNEQLAADLAEPTKALALEFGSLTVPPARMWRNLSAIGCAYDGAKAIVEMTCQRTVGRNKVTPGAISSMASCVAEILRVSASHALSAEELKTRSGPISMQWKARGPGLLKNLVRHSDEIVVAPKAEVYLVAPVQGGGGVAHLPFNTIRFEAMLANALDTLPEVVRLAWLLAQLNVDLPVVGENIMADRLPMVGQLALLPPALLAAEEVELVYPVANLWELAIETWIAPANAGDVNEQLRSWWEVYQEEKPKWPFAITALDRMLGDLI